MSEKHMYVIGTQQNAARPPPLAPGINVEKPKFPQYAVYSKRLESFDAWPEHIPVKKEDLVKAGLVYTGVGDSVRCYFCGGGLRNWERDDVPMEEHAKWYPTCPHIFLVKCQDFVEKLIRGEIPDEDGPQSQSDARQSSEPDPLESIPAQNCIQIGYPKDMVKKAINAFINKHGHSDYKARDLCEIIFELEDQCDESHCEANKCKDFESATASEEIDVADEIENGHDGFSVRDLSQIALDLEKHDGTTGMFSFPHSMNVNDQNYVKRPTHVTGPDDNGVHVFVLDNRFRTMPPGSQWSSGNNAQYSASHTFTSHGTGQHVCFPKYSNGYDDKLYVDGNVTDNEESNSDSGQIDSDVAVEEHNTARSTQTGSQINMEKPTFPKYSSYSERFKTFSSWPDQIPVKKEDLASAGFFYTGIEDHVQCYFCCGKLRKWERGDEPKREHAKWFPHCPISAISQSSIAEPGFSAIQSSEHDPLYSIPAQSCIQMGYSEEMVRKAIDIYVNKKGTTNYTGRNLCEIILDPTGSSCLTGNVEGNAQGANAVDREEQAIDDNELFLATLQEENARLKGFFTCIVCTDDQKKVLFLPCGHLVCCNDCASWLTKCPVSWCQMEIAERSDVFFARLSEVQIENVFTITDR